MKAIDFEMALGNAQVYSHGFPPDTVPDKQVKF